MTKNKKVLIVCASLAFTASLGLVLVKTQIVDATTDSIDTDYALALTDYTIDNFENLNKITDPNGRELSPTQTLFPTVVGEYVFSYNGYNTSLIVLRDNPVVDFVFEYEIKDSYKLGDRVQFPLAQIDSVLSAYTNYTVTIKCDGEEIKKLYPSQIEDYSLLLDKSGTYEAVYTCVDSTAVQYTASETIAFTVSSERALIMNTLPTSIYYGESILIGANFGVYNDMKYPATITATLPSGDREEITDIVYVPKEYGEYIFSVSVNIDGETLTQEQIVQVVVSTNTLVNGSAVSITPNVALPSYAKEQGTGLFIDAENEKSNVYYTKMIDLREKTAEDSLIEFFAYADDKSPKKEGIRVSLIDAHDPKTALTVYWWYNAAVSTESYTSVYLNAKEYGGISNETKNAGTVRKTYGTVMWNCYFNAYNQNKTSNKFNIAFDYATNAVYANIKGETVMILDMDNPEMVGESNVWDGFTTGEVYLKVEFNYASSIYITSFEEESVGYEFIAEPKNESVFSVVTDYKILPNGVVGYDYPIPKYIKNAQIRDVEVSVELYKNSTLVADLTGKSSFKVQEVGAYVLEYKAKDNYGKTIVKSYPITITQQPTPLSIEIESSALDLKLLEDYKMPSVTFNGGAGRLEVNTYLYCDNEIIAKNDETVFLTKKGEYKIVVNTVDYIGYTTTKEFLCSVDYDAVSMEFSQSLISARMGETVSLPTFTSYDYLTDSYPAKQLEVFVDGELSACYEQENYLFTVPNACDNITLVYYAGKGTARETRKEFSLRVLPATYSKIDNFLLYDRTSVVTDVLYNGVAFRFSKDGSIQFPNALSANDFKISFGIDFDYSAFSFLTLTLTDALNPNESVDFKFTVVEALSMGLSVNDDGRTFYANFTKNDYTFAKFNKIDPITTSEYKNRYYKSLSLVFDNYLGALKYENGAELATVKTLVNGKAFKGFTSGRVFASLSVQGVTSDTRILVASVMNQKINYSVQSANEKDFDNAGPSIYFDNKMMDAYIGINDSYTVYKANACDVIQSSSTVTVKVIAPNKSVVYEGAIDNNYLLQPTAYGLYEIVYTAIDKIGNVEQYTYGVNVIDDDSPIITVNGGYKDVVKVGETIKICFASIVDTDKNTIIKVYVCDSDNKMFVVNQGDDYTFEKAGVYYISYYAEDSYGHFGQAIYKIVVKL